MSDAPDGRINAYVVGATDDKPVAVRKPKSTAKKVAAKKAAAKKSTAAGVPSTAGSQ